MDAGKEILQLRAAIRAHNRRYYIDDDPAVSDEEYDRLLQRLQVLEDAHPELKTDDSPTVRVGGGVGADFKPVDHAVPMLSLDNSYDAADIRAWDERVKKVLGRDPQGYVVEPKIDGVSLALTYRGGKLSLGATRGDGRSGEDVTPNIRTIRAIPLALEGPETPRLLEVRGEVYIDKDDFAAINDELKEADKDPFVNPRNCASGSLRQKDPRVTASRRLKFFAHSFGRIEGGPKIESHSDFLAACRALGFAVPGGSRRVEDVGAVIAVYEEYRGRQLELPYEIDGLVAKVDLQREQKILGATTKSPRWAMAFKYPGRQATTTLRGVTFSVGRTGTITPVAELAPVFLSGVTISSASLHNFEEIERLDVRVGDTVMIERAGEVIPKVIKVVRHAGGKPVRPPKGCPACGGAVEQAEGFVAYRCGNPSCPAQLKRKLLHFASRDGMDIEGFGDAVVEQLVDAGDVKDISGIFGLTKERLLRLELFKDKKAHNLLAAIAAAKSRPLSKLLFALGIPQVGETTARDLAARFSGIDALMHSDEEALTRIPEIGPIVAAAVAQFFARPPVRALIGELKRAKVNMVEPKTAAPAGSPLAGKTFVFTGELAGMTRGEAEEKVRLLGGKASSSVSKKTSYVVVGAKPGSKAKKAEKLEVPILDLKAFLELLG
ncbi:MAG: NAD-dependent DNA ligase LigA [Elusimicrobiota bacterium]